MNDQWYFKEFSKGDTERDPIQGEFFASESIERPAHALIREGIQNSLDASIPGQKVIIHIYISGINNAIPPEKYQIWFKESWEHFKAKNNGLRENDIPAENELCRILIFEDFGTTGLTGDYKEWRKTESERKNPFFYFFRADGLSAKGEQDRGRWGVGKTVFSRASRINSYFGYTIRHDDKKNLMMGRSVLKHHDINNRTFKPDGYFGIEKEGLILPIEDKFTIQSFCETFNIKRKDEPGLSIVVPWYEKGITKDTIIEGIVEQYFYPILKERLIVHLEMPELNLTLDHDTIITEIKKINETLYTKKKSYFELITSFDEKFIQILNPPLQNGAPKWSHDIFTDECLEKLKSDFESGGKIFLRVPLIIYDKSENIKESYFDVYFMRDPSEESVKPVFIREGIIIPDNKPPRSRGICSLVIIEDKPLASLIGDAENPAHTQWQQYGSNFKDKYKYGPSYISFVINSVSQIVNFITESEKEKDTTLLIDFFSLPLSDKGTSRKTQKKPSLPPITGKPQKFRIENIEGGFRVSNGDDISNIPKFIRIQVAYNIRRGNPLKKYNKADFELDKSPINIEAKDVEIIEQKLNFIHGKINSSSFNIKITGFDIRRDLFVKVE